MGGSLDGAISFNRFVKGKPWLPWLRGFAANPMSLDAGGFPLNSSSRNPLGRPGPILGLPCLGDACEGPCSRGQLLYPGGRSCWLPCDWLACDWLGESTAGDDRLESLLPFTSPIRFRSDTKGGGDRLAVVITGGLFSDERGESAEVSLGEDPSIWLIDSPTPLGFEVWSVVSLGTKFSGGGVFCDLGSDWLSSLTASCFGWRLFSSSWAGFFGLSGAIKDV